MGGDGGNRALRLLLDEAGLSNTGLARAVVFAGGREGLHLGSSTTSVKRWLDGSQPQWPVPRLVAAALSQRLRRIVSITDCGFADRTPAEEDRFDGLSCAGTLEGTVRTVVELSGRDMRRRKFLLGSMFSAGAFAEPALVALTVPPAPSTAHTGSGRRIGMADVEVFTAQVTHLRQLDYSYGSGRVRAQVVQLLHHEATELLHGTYTAKTGQALLITVAQATKLAGFTAADIGRHSLAQRYFIQALDLAMRAGDRLYAAQVLSEMGWLTAQLGQNAPTDDDRLRNGRQAAALARAGLTIADGAVTPALAADLHALEGRGLALFGDASGARKAVLAAERDYERSRAGEEPPWLGFYTEAAFAADIGRCLADLGDPQQGITLSATAVRDYEPWRVRARCFAQTDLAHAHLLNRDLEQAAALGRDALRTATDVSSHRTLDRLRTLQRQITPLRSACPPLADLDARITDFLTRTTRRQQQDDR
ncbi:MAG: hypothetical protein ACRDTC_25870 [Pseudonocardiaceae bacterium]